MPVTTADLDNWFRYHAPTPEQIRRYADIREGARYFAELILERTPPGADQTAALRKIREAVMTANAAIACGEAAAEVAETKLPQPAVSFLVEDVKSTNVEALGWEGASAGTGPGAIGVLTVRFRNSPGKVYLYDAVPLALFEEIKMAESVGKAVKQRVVGGPYKFRVVDDVDQMASSEVPA